MSPPRASRPIGVVLLALGAVMAVGGLLGYVTSGSSASGPPSADDATTISATSAPDAGTTTIAATTTTIAATTTAPTTTTDTTTTVPPATIAATTTTIAATTTTAPPTTVAPTTTQPGSERVREFVDQYADALARDDVDFLLTSLHPVVIDGFGLETCRAWIQNEIVLIDAYRIVGAIDGPTEQSFTTPAGTGTIPDAYAAIVEFSFRGQAFEAEGGFAEVDGTMHWLGQCR